MVIEVDQNIDAIRMGMNPVVVQMDKDMAQPMMYHLDETEEPVQTAGNVLRYPLGQGIALDYMVTATQVKQNLVLRDQPFFGQEFRMARPAGRDASPTRLRCLQRCKSSARGRSPEDQRVV